MRPSCRAVSYLVAFVFNASSFVSNPREIEAEVERTRQRFENFS